MGSKPLVGYGDQPRVEIALPQLIPTDQDNRRSIWAKSESKAPKSVIKPEPKLLHIRKTRSFQRVHVWATNVVKGELSP
jgi:hypothetical protein